MNQNYFIPSIDDSLSIGKLNFYISDIQFYNDSVEVAATIKRHHLISVEDSSSMILKLDKTLDFNRIVFNLGIDSTINSSGAHGGDLDPVNGMYWTWNSGYINFKLEGTSKTCPARNNKFQYHLGGFLKPHYAMQTIDLLLKSGQSIQLDLDHFFEEIDLETEHTVMSPSIKAVNLSTVLKGSFKSSEQ